ncbi:insulinase family protein [Streptomyces griseoruber]|uniref:insulinase family protein n=1 Tax=Streptomyces griseoruber TaxID=1943 RepID=UPI0037AA12EB
MADELMADDFVTRMKRPGPLRSELSNGLRVLMDPIAEVPRVAVCVTYGVGFRSEHPGQEGLAHLFEHLMFRGSVSLPPGRFYDHILPLGGEANGTTHQDYTDYYQTVPSAALEPALFAEADRMRAPLLTEAVLAEQLAGVEEEITGRILDRPLGDFPWPLLPQALFGRHGNAHDGFGDITRLRGVTRAECAAFFDRNYAPGNAVLTLVGGFDPDEALALVERHFGEIPARPVRPRPELAEPVGGEDRWLRCTEPGIPATAVALGHRLPGPDEDLDHYLATMVMARIVTDHGVRTAPGQVLRTSSGCGFFGPLDALSPDALVTTSVLPDDVSPERFVDAVAEALSAGAGTDDLEGAVARTRLRLATEHIRAHGDLTTRCRFLGRLERLFGRAELVDEIPVRLEAVLPSQVTAASEAVRKASRGVLVIEPGPVRSRPAGRPAQVSAPARITGTSPGPRPVPLPGAQRRPVLRSVLSETLDTGLLVSVIEDHRTPLAEIRLRVPLGPIGLLEPTAVDASVRSLWPPDAGPHSRTEPRGLVVRRSPDGPWIEATGYASADALVPLLRSLASLTTAITATVLIPGTAGTDPTRDGGTLDGAMDRLLCTTLTQGLVTPEPVPLAAGVGSLAVVGPVRPAEVLDTLRVHNTARSPLAGHRDDTKWEAATVIRREEHGGPEPALPAARALLCAPEPVAGPDEAARYLATAVLGRHLRTHLTEALARLGRVVSPWPHDIRVGRDVFLGRPRAWVRAHAHGTEPDLLLTALWTATAQLADGPNTSDVSRAAEFCAAQMLAVFDSPSALADALARFGASGWCASTIVDFPNRLRSVSSDQVSDAVTHLYWPALHSRAHHYDPGE